MKLKFEEKDNQIWIVLLLDDKNIYKLKLDDFIAYSKHTALKDKIETKGYNIGKG